MRVRPDFVVLHLVLPSGEIIYRCWGYTWDDKYYCHYFLLGRRRP